MSGRSLGVTLEKKFGKYRRRGRNSTHVEKKKKGKVEKRDVC